jgi:hypothetical protein
MGKNKLKKNQVKRHNKVAHCPHPAAEAEPLPFEQNSYRSYLFNLQRQFNTIRAGMDKEARRKARLAGRANWIFRITELRPLPEYVGAVTMLLLTVLPACAVRTAWLMSFHLIWRQNIL